MALAALSINACTLAAILVAWRSASLAKRYAEAESLANAIARTDAASIEDLAAKAQLLRELIVPERRAQDEPETHLITSLAEGLARLISSR